MGAREDGEMERRKREEVKEEISNWRREEVDKKKGKREWRNGEEEENKRS